MTCDQVIRAALLPLVPVVVPNVYTGTEETFVVYRYTVRPDAHGDGRPHALRYLVTVHLYGDLGTDTVALRGKIRLALQAAGLTYPTETNACTEQFQHYAFDCEWRSGCVSHAPEEFQK